MAVHTQEAKRDVRTPSVTIGLVAAGTLLLALRNPHGGGYGICPILAITGYLCPTCGGLRAVYDLVHLDFAGAWGMNPLLTLALPFGAVFLLAWWGRAWLGLRALTIPAPVVIISAVALVGFGILRNF